MFRSCQKKNKSLFKCDHDSGSSGRSSNSNSAQWNNLNVEVYLQKTVTSNGNQLPSITTMIFKGITGVLSKKKLDLTNAEYQGHEVFVRVPTLKIQANCDLRLDLKNIRIKYYNSHIKTFDVLKVSRYDPDNWRSNIILIGELKYSESK